MQLQQTNCLPPRTHSSPISKDRLHQLKDLLQLEEQHLVLQHSLVEVRSQIEGIQSRLLQAGGLNSWEVVNLRPLSNGRSNRIKERMGRGELRARILNLLSAAGPKGAKVQDIAAAMGVRAVNIHSWFYSALRRLPQIRKAGPGQYYLAADSEAPQPDGGYTPTEAAPEIPTVRTRAKRGEVSERIFATMEKARGGDITVPEIAAGAGTTYRNVHVWLSGTGKKSGRIIRTGRGLYRLLASAPARTDGDGGFGRLASSEAQPMSAIA